MSINKYYDRSQRLDSVYDKINEEINKYYQIRFNDIALEFEIFDKASNKKIDFNESSILIHLEREKLQISPQKLKIYLKSHFVQKFNPLVEYFNQLPDWDGINHIKKYASYCYTDDNQLFETHLMKWAVRAVKTVFDCEQINKHAIVLEGGQSYGKSYYLNFLCPKQLLPYLYTSLGTDKDDKIKLAKSFLINIEELDVMGKYDVNSVKAYISTVSVNERLPYSDRSTLLYRTCSFLGSTNKAEFLNDETGSVRWLVFSVLRKIDFSYSKDFNIDFFWAQAYHIYQNDKSFNSELTKKEIEINEIRNNKFAIQTIEYELIIKYFNKSDDINTFITSTEMLSQLKVLGLKLSIKNLGAALRKLNFVRVKHAKRQVYGYLAQKKYINTPLEYSE